MRSDIRRLVAMLVGMVLLPVTVVSGVHPTPATASGAGTAALEFQPTDYPQCRTDGTDRSIRYLVDKIVSNSPDRFDADGDPTDEDAPLYQPPTGSQRVDFRAGLRALIDDDPTTATTRLGAAGFAVCSGEVDGTWQRDMVLVYDPDGLSAAATTGAPMLLLAPGMEADASLLSGPHLRAELRIKDQILAAVAQTALGYVRGAVLSGTHRCNRLAEAPEEYQGTTSMCGGTYRISDMAHNVDTIFQDMHDVIRQEYPETYAVQLHGMSANGISVSRGEDPDDGWADHPEDAVTRAHSYAQVWLSGQLAGGGLTAEEKKHHDNLTSCTPYVHSVSGLTAPTRDLHCATRNAQLDRERDHNAADRFIHIEQSLYVRDHYPEHVIWVMYGLFAD